MGLYITSVYPIARLHISLSMTLIVPRFCVSVWHVAQILICRYTYADTTRRCKRPAAKTIAENGDCKQSVLSFCSYWNESLNNTKPTPIQSIWQNCRLRKKTVSRRSIVPYDSKLIHPKILSFGLLGILLSTIMAIFRLNGQYKKAFEFWGQGERYIAYGFHRIMQSSSAMTKKRRK